MNIAHKRSFTLMELIVVIVIVASIASFALVNYNRTLLCAHEQDAVMQLKTIHAANMIHFAKNGDYWPPDADSYGIDEINENLDLFIFSGDITYSCSGSDGSTFYCSGAYTTFEIFIMAGQLTETNPCCAGSCLTLGNCP